jgi:hypothetical protein
MPMRHRTLIVSGILIGAVSGCASGRLVPLESARHSADPAVGISRASGVHLQADPEAWQGSPSVALELTEVRLSIQNHSGATLYVAREDIELVGADRRLSALDPDELEPRSARASLGTPPGDPLFPPPAPARSNAVAMDSPVGASDTAMAPVQTYQQPLILYTVEHQASPEAEVESEALAAGPLPNGGTLRGFVYFERLPKRSARMDLRVTLRRSPGGPAYATLSVPFAVKR